MKLIVGLGNPGKEYEGSRHNMGFVVVDRFLKRMKANDVVSKDVSWKESEGTKAKYLWFETSEELVELFKPQAFMNKSGEVVQHVFNKHHELNPSDMLVIHDDMGFEPGNYKFSRKKEANSHNGVDNIIETIGTNDFWRLRVGIGGGNKDERRQDAADYVLERSSYWQQKKIDYLIKSELLEKIILWVHGKIN